MIDTFQRESAVVNWHSDHEIGQAIWNVVRLCRSDDASCVRAWVSDFISRVCTYCFYSLQHILF